MRMGWGLPGVKEQGEVESNDGGKADRCYRPDFLRVPAPSIHFLPDVAVYAAVPLHMSQHPPLSLAMASPPASVDPGVYLPPALREGSVGWYPESGKVWEQYGIPKYVI